jgi:hypothetical protein
MITDTGALRWARLVVQRDVLNEGQRIGLIMDIISKGE